MSDPAELTTFIDALRAEGVDPAALAQADDEATVIGLGATLLQGGAATLQQLEGAQQRVAAAAPQPQRVQRLGHYEIERRLGSGGMGEVYLVRDPTTGGRFAAKRLLGMAGVETRKRFKREARVLAKLEHPHLGRVHTAELEGPTPFFVLGYYPGGTLGERLKQGPLTDDESRQLLIKLADAVATAHEQGILHRDLKPDNVLFDDQGEPRLVDFGLGLSVFAAGARLTETGAILGTPAYMSPEQAENIRSVNERSDVYGLGAILYACLTGRAPVVSRGSVFATLRQVLEGTIDPPSATREVDPRLEAICMRALAKKPARRFASAGGLRDALLEVGAPRPRSSLGATVGGVVAGLCAAIGILVAWSSGPAPPEPVPEEPVEVPEDPPPTAETPRVAALRPYARPGVAFPYDDPVFAWRELQGIEPDDPELPALALDLLAQIGRADDFPLGVVKKPLWHGWRNAWIITKRAERMIDHPRATLDDASSGLLPLIGAMRLCADYELPRSVEEAVILRGLDAWVAGFNRVGPSARRSFAKRFALFAQRYLEGDCYGRLTFGENALRFVESWHDVLQPDHGGVEVAGTGQLEDLQGFVLAVREEHLVHYPPHLFLEMFETTSSCLGPPVDGAADPAVVVPQRIRRWLEGIERNPPLRYRWTLEACRRIAMQLLQLPGVGQEPNHELAGALLRAARRLPPGLHPEPVTYHGYDVIEAQVALCAGRLADAEALLQRAPEDDPEVDLVRAAILLVRARGLAPGAERAALLDQAEVLLDASQLESKVRFAAQIHLAALRGEAPPRELEAAWKRAEEQLRPWYQEPVVLPWYLGYVRLHTRFPCEPLPEGRGPGLSEVWIPGALHPRR